MYRGRLVNVGTWAVQYYHMLHIIIISLHNKAFDIFYYWLNEIVWESGNILLLPPGFYFYPLFNQEKSKSFHHERPGEDSLLFKSFCLCAVLSDLQRSIPQVSWWHHSCSVDRWNRTRVTNRRSDQITFMCQLQVCVHSSSFFPIVLACR